MTPEIHLLTRILESAELLGHVGRTQMVLHTVQCDGTISARARGPCDFTEPLTILDALGAIGEGETIDIAVALWLRSARAELCRLRRIERALATLAAPAWPDERRAACKTLLTMSSRFDHVMLARQHLETLPPPFAHAHAAE